jgi:putative nucleotidyltransferase with HDIG domain
VILGPARLKNQPLYVNFAAVLPTYIVERTFCCMPGISSHLSRPVRQRYFAIDLASLRVDRLLSFDLYLNVQGQMVLYRDRALPFTQKDHTRLMESKHKRVYVDEAQRSGFLGYMEKELPDLLQDPKINLDAKANIVYETSKVIVENIFENPGFSDNIGRTESLVGETVGFVTKNPESFRSIVSLSDVDYKLYSHSVNVCTYSLGLAQHIGIDDPEELAALGIGAMLHDIGKTKIDARILRKRSRISHAELELMKKHVTYGMEILRNIPNLPKAALIPVLQHSEREDGSGYPNGLRGQDIHVFGKIVAIADVYDALTTNRVYKQASTAFEAFQNMLDMPLDRKLVLALISLLGPTQEDQSSETSAAEDSTHKSDGLSTTNSSSDKNDDSTN